MANDISPSKRKRLIAKTGGRCGYCGTPLHDLNRHFDHIIPKSKGGSNRDENLLAACDTCNRSKGTKSIEEFRLTQALKASRHNVKFSISQLLWLDAQEALEGLLGDAYHHTFYFEHAGVRVQGVAA